MTAARSSYLAASRTIESDATATATWNERPLPVNHAPTVTLPCAAGGFVFGQAATFTAVGQDVDNDTLTYTWQKNGVDLGGAGSSISVMLQAGDVLNVLATDSKGAKSASATLAPSCGHAAPPAPPTPPAPPAPPADTPAATPAATTPAAVAPPAAEAAVVLTGALTAVSKVVSQPTVKPKRKGVVGARQTRARVQHHKPPVKTKTKVPKAKPRTPPVALRTPSSNEAPRHTPSAAGSARPLRLLGGGAGAPPWPGDVGRDDHHPKLHVRALVREGTDASELNHGPSHYPWTALPGQGGTVAIAGHRTTYGAWFRHIDQLLPGDLITVALRSRYGGGSYRYRIAGHRIVPWNTGRTLVRDNGSERLILSACHPPGSDAYRYIVYAYPIH